MTRPNTMNLRLDGRGWFQAGRAALILLITIACALTVPKAFAAAPAGTPIGNQASATYTDANNTARTVTSNSVVTVVQQVASLTLSANNTKTGAIGGQMYYPHTITNTGNGADTFNLTVGQSGAISLNSFAYYLDANGDGLPDNNTPITSTGELAAGVVFKFVASGTVPNSAVAGNTNTLTVTAASTLTPATTAANTDVTTVTGNAVVQVSQQIDLTQGPSSGTRTITLTYTNVGNVAAANVTLTDAVPSGMTYVAGSARWSVTGSTVLTDASNSDNQGGIIYDFTNGTATAVIASVAPGATGTVTFQASVNAGLPAGANPATRLTATFGYNDGAGAVSPTNTNTVQYTVLNSAGVTLGDSTIASASQGSTVTFTNLLTNTGNLTDAFNITLTNSTFPAGTTFQLFKSDGVTPLISSNADGIPDTGPVAPGGTYNVIVKATLPTNAGTGPYTVQPKATSQSDTTKTATATDTLSAVTAGSVDLTNNTAGGPGVGAGPEGSPAITNTVAPGGTSRFVIVVANGTATDDTYNLQASTDSTFSTVTLPAGWTVVFKDAATGQPISSTGLIPGNTNKTIWADVTAPTGSAASIDLYFRGRSPTSLTTDVLHDAITIATTRSLTITPNQIGQLVPGGTYVYTHTITNTGNVLEGDGSASTTALAATSSAGFTSVIYWDKNNDGQLDASDPIVTNLSQLTGGTNGASTAAGLSVGESATLFVKVTAPASATTGATDVTTLTATTTGVISGAAAPAVASATETSTVISSEITLTKKQAIDVACDGTADTAFSASPISAGASPGVCIRYEVTATNAGTHTITSVVINDTTPAFTVYTSTGAAAASVGSITQVPADGAAGALKASVGSLAAGTSATLTFGVKIVP